jgi:hypothetical protein
MRWPHESAITRRDEHLARTRKLSLWIAGGATAASLGLAAALGTALPGHAVNAASPSGSATSNSANTGSGNTGSGNTGSGNTGSTSGTGPSSQHAPHKRAAIAPPKQAPAHTKAPPVVSSGGS